MKIKYLFYNSKSVADLYKYPLCLRKNAKWLLQKAFILEETKGIFFIDEEVNQIIGYGFTYSNGLIFSIFVFPQYRNKHFGTLILKGLINYCGGSWLEVYKNNNIALQMYKNLGFKITKELDNIFDSCGNLRQGYKMEL